MSTMAVEAMLEKSFWLYNKLQWFAVIAEQC